ncbi:hypothetical protein CBL_21465, partial [Carabus blaptoides fortunei]
NICRERWIRLRDNHRKALHLRKTRSGQAASKLKPPNFDKELSFLVGYLFDEETRHSNISSPTTISNDNDSEAEDRANFDEEHHNDIRLSETFSDGVSAPSSSGASTPIFKKRRIGSRCVSEEPSAAAVLKDFLKSRENTNKNKQCGQQIAADDHLTNFFITMAQTVKTFPLHDQIEIK